MEVRTLTDAELAALDVDGVWAHLVELQRFTNRLDAYRARVVAVADEKGAAAGAGRRRMADALVAGTGMASGDARRAVRAAGVALENAAVAGLFEQGQITQTHAVAVGGARVPEEVRTRLLAEAPAQTTDETIERVAAAERAQVDPAERFMRQREMRSASRCYDRDGMWNMHVRLDPEAGARADAVLTARSEELWRDDKQAGRTRARTPIQRLADTFTAILDAAAAGGGGKGPTVTLNVTIPHTWLTEQAHTTGVTNDGAMLSAETLRRLACDAHLLPTVLGGAGEVLDVGRARRTATDAQHRGLEARDGGCFNCGAPPSRCHAHHIDHWAAHDGCTDIDRLVLVCHDCHILLHEGGHRVVRQPGGGWALAPPDDSEPAHVPRE
jgi:5-methylcytosine-specific restriction protein A